MLQMKELGGHDADNKHDDDDDDADKKNERKI